MRASTTRGGGGWFLPLCSFVLMSIWLAGCGGDEGGASECTPGTEGCVCAETSLCFGTLECLSGTCVDTASSGSGSDSGATDDVDGGIGDDSESTTDTTTTGDTGNGSSGTTSGATTDTTDGGCPDGLTNCNGECVDTNSDTKNCGGCGVVCEEIMTDFLESGGCQAGVCLPVWSECIPYESLTPCSEVCANEGKTCEQGACEGGTLLSFPGLQECQVGLGSGSPVQCNEPSVVTNAYYRCCCAQ